MAQRKVYNLLSGFIRARVFRFSNDVVRGSTIICLILGVLLILGDANGAFGARAWYEVIHNFDLRPGGNVAPNVQVKYFAEAWVEEGPPYCKDNDKKGPGAIGIPPAGGGGAIKADATKRCNSQAWAECSYNVNGFLPPGTPVTGWIKSEGEIITVAPPGGWARGSAANRTAIEAQGGVLCGPGIIIWGGIVREEVTNPARPRGLRDPITFRVVDPATNDTLTGTLFSIEWNVLKEGLGGIIWENDMVTISAEDAELIFDLTSPYTVEQGYLELKVEDGKVVSAVNNGIYGGLSLPSVDEPVPVTFELPNQQPEFHFEICDLGRDDLEVTLNLGVAGEAAIAEGEPPIPTLTEWGLIIFGVVLLGFITWVFLRRRKAVVSLR